LDAANVPGYARVPIQPFTPAFNESDGSQTMVSAQCAFSCTGAPAAPQDCWGMFVVQTGAPDVLLAAEIFPQKFTFGRVGDGFALSVSWNERGLNPRTLTTELS